MLLNDTKCAELQTYNPILKSYYIMFAFNKKAFNIEYTFL